MKANSRKYPWHSYQRSLQAHWWLLLKCCLSRNIASLVPSDIIPNHTNWTCTHLGPVSPVRTLLGAEVRTAEGTSSHQMIRASLSLSQMQMKEQLTHDEWEEHTCSHAMGDVFTH